MRWDGNRESDNVEDRSGGGSGLVGGRIGLGSIAIALLAWLLFDINPLTLLSAMDGQPAATQQAVGPSRLDPEQKRFVATVLADTEDVWRELFQRQGASYRDPRLVLFSGRTATACGSGEAAMGPFYCPADQQVYIDLSFYDTLKRQLGAPGDFAQAYVIAHEVGHHVQHLTGTSDKVHQLQARQGEAAANALSVRLELQADCYAGVWAHHAQAARKILEPGDLEEALNAAARIGDDALQQAAGRAVVPDAFTHGSSAQRVRWFRQGYDGGDPARCDTFTVAEP